MTDPTFLYIGTAKAGSSWMYEVLREHPEVFVPPAKDIYFFDKHYARGLGWYRSFFEAAAGRRAIGELSHDYFLDARVAERIARDLPEVRLVCCLREPLDWAVSAYGFNQGTTHGADLSFEAYIQRPEIFRQLEYGARLAPFFGLFPRDRIRVFFYDELSSDPEGLARRLYQFIGVDPGFVPASLHERVNAAHQPRVQRLAHAAYWVGGRLRAVGAANLVGVIKRHPLTEKILYRPRREHLPVEPVVAARLRQSLAGELTALERLLGRPLPAAWQAPGERPCT